nr:hypothetical protein [Tanacetum cinerariifolium]
MSLEDKERRRKKPIQEDAPITGGIIDIGDALGANKSTKKLSNDTEEMVNVLSLTKAANILSSEGATFSTVSVSPANVFPTAGVPTVSGSFPTVGAIFTTATVATPYTRRSRGITIRSLRLMRIPITSAKDKGKEKVPQDYNTSSAVPCLFIHILCDSLSLYPFTEHYAHPYFFSCLIRQIKKEKEGLDSKLTCFESASKDLDTLLGSQRSDKNKEGLGYSVVPPSCSSLLSSQEKYVLDRIA